ncbi:uncharacterized protein DDB_G0287625-like [Palaemon carinicauda]|uniref:uncharacterized protein DDB_G0287625-like n=1 Tax=Palaemon carinicauda TaxID=392227 RepID=UPI0035B5F068
MRHFLWVLLAALSALATAQNEQPAIAQLAKVSPETTSNDGGEQISQIVEEPPSDKAAQGILDAVSAVVGSLVPSIPSLNTAGEETPSTEASEAVSTDNSSVVETADANVADTEAPVAEVAETEEVTEAVLSKKDQKAVEKYNDATDKLLAVLAQKMKTVDTFPIQVDEAAFLTLDEAGSSDTEPEPTGNTKKNGGRKNNDKQKKKNKKNRRKNNKRNNNRDNVDLQEEEQGRDKNKNSNEKNNNRTTEKGNNNSSEKKNKNKNKNKNNRNKRKNKNNASRRNRQPKAINDDEDEDTAVAGRRKGGNPVNLKNRNNNMNNNKKNKKQNKNDKKGKNKKKNKNRKNKNKGRSEIQAREVEGPVLPTNEERSESNALLSGLSNLFRNGDVTVDTSGKKDKVEAHVTVGPLTVNLKDRSRKLKKAEITTNLKAMINLKVKAVSRRSKISLSSVGVMELTAGDVSVIRKDLELQSDVINTAQETVVSAIDTNRLARVLSEQISDILNEDDILENLENHPFLRN